MDEEFKIVGRPGNSRVIYQDKSVKEKKIRFITTDYETLFELNDGGIIRIIFPDGGTLIRICDYLDETHVRIGGHVYHIHEFALKMRQAGNKVERMELRYENSN